MNDGGVNRVLRAGSTLVWRLLSGTSLLRRCAWSRPDPRCDRDVV